MKKRYTYLSLLLLLFFGSNLNAQVLETQNFENGIAVTDFIGWDASILFSISQTNPCEGSQSMRVNMRSSNTTSYIQSPVQVATGDGIDISFEYKLVSNSGLMTTGNFGSIDLYYSTDASAASPTWILYDSIDQNDVPTSDCSTHSYSLTAAEVPSGSDFAWKAESNWTTGDYYFYFDNFNAVEQVGCIQPINIEATNITSSSADISWVDPNGTPATSYTVYYCFTTPPSLPSPFCSSVVVTGATQTTITGLNDGQLQYIYVVADCGGTSSSSSDVYSFQTIAVGSDCSDPIQVNAASPALPFTDSGQMATFGDNYSGSAGSSCNSGSVNLLDGYDVVYTYTPAADDILTIDVTGLTVDNAGVFVYESCSDIGSSCFAGEVTDTGADLNLNSLFVTQGQSYYIVIATLDNSGNPGDTPFQIDITGFDCSSWNPPSGSSLISFVSGQTLSDFSGNSFGAEVTIDSSVLTWYYDNSGVMGAQVTTDISTLLIQDTDVFWVTQSVAGCESPGLQITFDEFDCNVDLGCITSTVSGDYCDEGVVALQASAGTSNIYWYETATGGDPVYIGSDFNTPLISQTTSYYVSEAFLGVETVVNQGNPGPTSF